MPQSVFHDGYRFLGSKERLSFDEILRITRVAASLGLRKIRITGGEPLLRPNLADLIGDLGAIEGIDDIALTTNGILLAKYATELKAAGLSRITVSLDSLDPEVFATMSGGFGGVAQVLEGIEAALAVGLTPIKINTVVQRGVNDQTVLDLIERGKVAMPGFGRLHAVGAVRAAVEIGHAQPGAGAKHADRAAHRQVGVGPGEVDELLGGRARGGVGDRFEIIDDDRAAAP